MREMTALDARYHKQCLTALANTNTNPKSEFNIAQAIGGIMMGELIIYIIWERDQTDADVNSTRIKERLITAYKRSNNKVFCVLAENLGEVVDLSTKTKLNSVAVMLAEDTQISSTQVSDSHVSPPGALKSRRASLQ